MKLLKFSGWVIFFFIGDDDFYYSYITTSENNYLYFLTSSYPSSNIRKFYILDNEGSVSFIEKNLTIEERDQVKKGRYESELFLIKLLNENSNKEYLLSVSKAPQYIELYDFYENKVYFKRSEVAFGSLSGSFNIVWPILKLYSNNNQNKYLIGISANEKVEGTYKHYFYIKKVSFSSIDINNNLPNCEVTQKIECSESKSISCYKTNNNYIACFYDSNEFQYTMIVYDNDFNQKKTEVIYQSNDNSGYDKLYFKCIHFFGETGVFNYFTTNDENPISIFKFKTYIEYDNSISDAYKTFTEIKFENIFFSNEWTTNCDII